jgi:hypothetical protein
MIYLKTLCLRRLRTNGAEAALLLELGLKPSLINTVLTVDLGAL